MKINRVLPLQASGNSKIAAYVDVETTEGIVIKNFKIVKGNNGLFISAPCEKAKDGKFYDSVMVPRELKTDLEKQALTEYTLKMNSN